MKKHLQKLFTLLLAVVLLVSFSIPSMAATSKASLKLSQKSISVEAGKTKTIKATVTGKSKTVKWTSSNKKVATVSSKGVVKGIKKGTCKITAKANGKTKTCTVKVKAVPGVSKAMLNAYAKKLKEYNSGYNNFALVYFDNDSKPELLITSSFSVHVAVAELYTYKNGKVVEIKDAGSDFGRFIYVPKKGVAIQDAWANGYGSITKYLKYNSSYSYKTLAKFESVYTGGSEVYKYNGSKVSKATYTSKTNSFIKKYPKKALNPEDLLSVDSSNINKMLKNYKSVVKTGK